ncbi:MAG: gluconate 2-dehydrogenase subunit 3 family protein [Bryobacterales bacterium]|nr:gluconate 2-dehydrogenase subunit 3 family protein [Bryobacterales bacterium]
MFKILDDVSRRDALRTIGASAALTASGTGVLTLDAAQHVHQEAASQKASGPYKPKALNAQEYRSLRRLAEMIIPPDAKSKGAIEAGAPEYIDLLCANNGELKEIYTGGLGWLDREMKKRYGALFADAKPEQQTAMLDLIAYRKNDSPALAPGIRFFTWARNMVVDAFYTSKTGFDDLGFMGNGAMAEFKVPQEAMDYALKRSGL